MVVKTVIFGALGTEKDNKGTAKDRWKNWRPTVDLCSHKNLPIARYELFYQAAYFDLAKQVKADIESRTATKVGLNLIDLGGNPWNFEKVYGAFFDFFAAYKFAQEKEDYYVNITTGTHVMQICLFLLAEARYVPAKLIQSTRDHNYIEIDLRLEKYDKIEQRLKTERQDDVALLKNDIDTKNAKFDTLIKNLLFVSSTYDYSILLTGSTGVGKTSLAGRIHDLRVKKKRAAGDFIAINCGTLSGDTAKSELFGHKKGSFTSAVSDRTGLLKLANGGTLFLDEIGELDPDVQKMILTAIEEKKFRPLGDVEYTESDFYLIAGTNSDLGAKVKNGRFREDLLARIDAFHFHIPDLKNRPEDIEPNLYREIQRFSSVNNTKMSISDEARKKYLKFAQSPEATWNSNFRDLRSSVVRMSAYAESGRITRTTVDTEIDCLRDRWGRSVGETERFPLVRRFFGDKEIFKKDLFDLVQLEAVMEVCLKSASQSEAGRSLFSASIRTKASKNDASRLRSYLQKHGLDWTSIQHRLR
jgi:transcriptional regulatory protein RtcR